MKEVIITEGFWFKIRIMNISKCKMLLNYVVCLCCGCGPVKCSKYNPMVVDNRCKCL
jgi:hypothetical protein